MDQCSLEGTCPAERGIPTQPQSIIVSWEFRSRLSAVLNFKKKQKYEFFCDIPNRSIQFTLSQLSRKTVLLINMMNTFSIIKQN